MTVRDIYVKIETIDDYSPVDPEPKSAPPKQYRRDQMRNEGHANGTIPDDEVEARRLTALVYREYLDPNYRVPKVSKLILADDNEPVFDHRVPGAVLYARPGERLRIHVLNGDSESHSFHVHGLSYGIDGDGSWPLGVPGREGELRSDGIPPGQSWTYSFDVTEEMFGAWPFHDHHANIAATVSRGLFGGIIVLPEDEKTALPPLAMPPIGHAILARSAASSGSEPRGVLADEGEMQALRSFLSEWAGLAYNHPTPQSSDILHVPLFLHLLNPASSTDMPAMDNARMNAFAAVLPPAAVPPLFDGNLDPGGDPFTFTFTDEGTYSYRCNIHTTMTGAVVVTADGPATVTVNVRDQAAPMGFEPARVTVRRGGTVTWMPGEMSHTVSETGHGLTVHTLSYCMNGRSFVGNTPTIVAQAGQTIRWYLFNLDLSTGWHNFHIHSQRWRMAGRAMDTLSIGPAESLIVETKAPPVLLLPPEIAETQAPENRPKEAREFKIQGDFLFHCHVEMHMMQGLAGLVRSRQSVWLTDEQRAQLPFDITLLQEEGLAGPAANAPTTGSGHDAMHGMPMPFGPSPAAPSSPSPPPAALSPNTVPPIITAEAATDNGRWEEVSGNPEVVAMHSILLPNTSKVLFYGYAQTLPNGDISRLWDLSTGTYAAPANQPIAVAVDPAIENWDLHSSEHAQLDSPDGEVLVHGGNTSIRSYVFNPRTSLWSKTADNLEGRYYSTTIPLRDGKVMTLFGTHHEGGHEPDLDPEVIAHSMEVYDAALAAWSPGSLFPNRPAFDYRYYPWTFLLPGGDLFIAGHQGITRRFDLNNPQEDPSKTWQTNAGDRSPNDQQMGTAALLPLLPPNYEPRVLIAGGDPHNANRPEQTAETIDLSVANPQWTYTRPLNGRRVLQVNSVLLPDGRVFLAGGMPGASGGPGPAEIFDPRHPELGWVVGDTMKHYRLYHSSAILLPDGSVLMGGDPRVNGRPTPHERYLPSYFEQTRPTIDQSPPETAYGAQFTIATPNAAAIAEVVLIRPSAATHGFNMTQRSIGCTITNHDAASVTAQSPPDGTVAPPGWYLLFVVDQNRVPSVATWIRIRP